MRKITFVLPEEKPNGAKVSDELLKDWKPLFITFDSVVLPELNSIYGGWYYNDNIGEVDFTSLGGVGGGSLCMYCVKNNN